MQLHLSDLHRSTTELRRQLSQLRKIQVRLHDGELQPNLPWLLLIRPLVTGLISLARFQMQNQDSVHTLLRQAEADLGLCLIEASRTQEDPLQRQRLLVEEERLRYLNEEELIIQQLQWANAHKQACVFRTLTFIIFMY